MDVTVTNHTSAAEATVVDVLEYLDGEFAAFSRGFADAQYSLWIGSGISLCRVDGLKSILLRALDRLHSMVDPSDADCRYQRGMKQILNRSGLSKESLGDLDLSTVPSSWPARILSELLNGLAQNYSKVLDVRITGEAADHLLWDIVDVRASYASPGTVPDCEHLAIAVLSLEGHVPQIISANWDGLIEKAFELLGHQCNADISVCVQPNDLEGISSRTRLIKFHGCAVRAAADEKTYRPLLIHQAHQIANYHNNPSYIAVRNELVSQATIRPTLMIGLSAQDSDIQHVFSDAAAARTRDYPHVPPAYVFAEDELGADQGTILRSVYGDAFDTAPEEIERAAVIRAYAKALLTSLLLHVLCQKLQALARRSIAPSLAPSDFDAVSEDIQRLRDIVACQSHIDPLELVRRIAYSVGATMHLFRTGTPAEPKTSPYWPLTSVPLHAIEADADIQVGGLPELAVALGLVANGVGNGNWSIVNSGPESSFEVTSAATGAVARVFFASNARSAIALEQSGLVHACSDDALVIHSDTVAPSLSRSPRSAPGRTGRPGLRRVDMVDLLANSKSLNQLRQRFREESGL